MKHRVTASGRPPELPESESAPAPIDPISGQHKDHWVLSVEERSKGFLRPVRYSYTHVGNRPKYPLRDLTQEEHERYDQYGYIKFEAYPQPNPDGSSVTGSFWTAERLKSGCGFSTRMGQVLAETYARDPKFYGATFCAICKHYFPVDQFVWDGTEELVGS